MVAILGCIGVVLVLTAMWLGAIIVDRYINAHWDTSTAHCEREEVPTHMECQH